MLEPRSLSERRVEIAESCRRRGVQVDLDAAIALQQRVASLQTELSLQNRKRKDHQAAGRKLPPEERGAHGAGGRLLKQQIARPEAVSRIFASCAGWGRPAVSTSRPWTT